jgi:hypothetical protein
MASDYRGSSGWGVALASLTRFSPQPRSVGVQVTRRTFVGSGPPIDEGLYVVLQWSIRPNAASYQALLTQLGILSATAANVTVYARNQVWTYARYNGVALQPQMGQDADWAIFPRNISVVVRDLVAL